MTMTIKHVTVQQARKEQASGATYIDVRSIPEFQQGHPEGAFNVPLLHADPATRQMRPNPQFLDAIRANFPVDARLVIGCQMGGRSQTAAEILANAGYHDVANVLGGYGGAPHMGHAGWVQAGLPVEQRADAAREYDALHKKIGASR
jgi:rhodanese-related sulfurtransferase